MIKTITNLTISKWRDIDTNEVTAESLIIEYIDEHGKTNETGMRVHHTSGSHKRGREMNKRYKVCPLFWSDYGGERTLVNMGVFEELLNEGWQILRVDTMPPTELRNNAVAATNVYILEREANDD